MTAAQPRLDSRSVGNPGSPTLQDEFPDAFGPCNAPLADFMQRSVFC